MTMVRVVFLASGALSLRASSRSLSSACVSFRYSLAAGLHAMMF